MGPLVAGYVILGLGTVAWVVVNFLRHPERMERIAEEFLHVDDS